ncbi:hypothetical protein ACH5RR_012796, partial [Cinchona calisaya]
RWQSIEYEDVLKYCFFFFFFVTSGLNANTNSSNNKDSAIANKKQSFQPQAKKVSNPSFLGLVAAAKASIPTCALVDLAFVESGAQATHQSLGDLG